MPEKILSCCDKLDNARSMNDDYALVGDELWERFNAPKTDIFWYYKECLKAYETGVSIEGSRVFRLLKREVGIYFEDFFALSAAVLFAPRHSIGNRKANVCKHI